MEESEAAVAAALGIMALLWQDWARFAQMMKEPWIFSLITFSCMEMILGLAWSVHQ